MANNTPRYVQDKKTGQMKGSLGVGMHAAPKLAGPAPTLISKAPITAAPGPVTVPGIEGWHLKYDEGMIAGIHYNSIISREGTRFRQLTPEGRALFCENIERLGPPREWHPKLAKFIKKNDITAGLPGKSAFSFMIINTLASNRFYGFNRGDLRAMREAYAKWFIEHPDAENRPSDKSLHAEGDPIQHVNKSGQWGLVHQTLTGEDGKAYYRLDTPFKYRKYNRGSQSIAAVTDETRDAEIARIRAFHEEYFINVPNDKWEVGHADPRKGDSTFMQPPFQGAYRDRFKFDPISGMTLTPTVGELLKNPDKYYDAEELEELYLGLQALMPRMSYDVGQTVDSAKQMLSEEAPQRSATNMAAAAEALKVDRKAGKPA